ncbi:MAG: 1,4-alpha-glucan branching enzyme, partial [Gemmatimonadetes bacterium]|nr:1,4-alpha-glucan branching enzyme [Gemmatimonadota bacterium]
TLIFNFGRNEVKSFLLSNALYWIEHFHIDGLRVDAVASMLYLDYSREQGEWIPNRLGGRENLEAIEFLKEMNTLVYGHFPGVMTLAEESTAWPAVSRPTYSGGLGFGFKWNMGWMNDVLDFMAREPVHRKYHHGDMTFGMLYAYHENFVLPLSHDEVVHGKGSLLGKMPGDDWQQFANLRLLYAYMYGFPGKKLLFMGAEIAQRTEWNYATSLEWQILEHAPHRGVQSLLRDLNSLYRTQPALHASEHEPSGFAWIDHQDVEASVLAFERRHNDEVLIFICNFTPVARSGYRVGLPRPGTWREEINTDATDYAGSGVGNTGVVTATDEAWHGRRWSAVMDLPPLAALVLSPIRG